MQPDFTWGDLAFGSKKPVNSLKATFIAAPRELSAARFKELVKQFLPQGNIVLGLALEPYINGFDGQPQFRTLQIATVESIIRKVNAISPQHKIYTFTYAQRDSRYIFEKLTFARVVLVNGSWQYSFHTQAPYYALVNRGTPYQMVSPFVGEDEARAYEAGVVAEIEAAHPFKRGTFSEVEMLGLAQEASMYSFDYAFQTGVALGKKSGDNYRLLLWAYNRVVPYQTYALHHGASREKHFSPPNDLNHYDAVHAEVEAIVSAGKAPINLQGATLFINLLPCPSCARMLAETDIAEIVYTMDHSDGYAVHMLEAAGKTVRRVVP
nr:Cytidine and deoxycytidylate deaminase zinc-binding region [uncultured bacterium]